MNMLGENDKNIRAVINFITIQINFAFQLVAFDADIW